MRMYGPLAVILSVLMATSVSGIVSGDDIACGDATTPYYTGTADLEVDTYDVYVKLGRPGQSAVVNGYARSGQSTVECQNIGHIEAAGDEWRKLGAYQVADHNENRTFQLSSPTLANLPDANRPSLLFVSRIRPACVPTVECETQIDGQKAFIRPRSNSLAENALRITVAKAVNNDSVKRVSYYVDNELMYQTKTLESFDMQAVPYYGTVMTRVIEYASGQTAVLQSDVPDGYVDNAVSILTRTAKKYADILVLCAVVFGVLIIVWLIRALIYYQRKRYYWQVWHGFIKEKISSYPVTESINWQRYRRIYKRAYTVAEVIVLTGSAAVGLVLLVNAYVGQMAVVRGKSMEGAYGNGQTVIVNKLPITLARINHKVFIPQRGEVVVARPSYGASVDSAETGSDVIMKRVIGLPGDKVVVSSSGKITIFNAEHPHGFSPETGASWAGFVRSEDDIVGDIAIVLNESELFLVGDNRSVSIDSRFNGPVAAGQLVGIVVR